MAANTLPCLQQNSTMPSAATLPPTWFAEPGRLLLAERDAATWRLADWSAASRREGVSPARQGAQLNVGREKFSALARVADAFPPDRRDTRASFDVHAQLARLPAEDRDAALARAAAEGWSERRARALAVEYRQAAGAGEDDDFDYRAAVELKRMWNRAPPEAREYFAGWAESAGTGIIDEDQANA